MTLANDLLWLDPRDIVVDRGERQRRSVATKNLLESIRDRGILNPLIVEQVDGPNFAPLYQLVAGERRLAASLELGLAQVPCRNWSDLDPIESQIIELEENVKREDLPWQDNVGAVRRIHELLSQRAEAAGGDWTLEATGNAIGMLRGTISMYLRVARALGEERILAATTVREAYNALQRRDEREAGAQVQSVLDAVDGLVPVSAEFGEGLLGGDPGGIIEYDKANGPPIIRATYATASARPPLDPTRSILHESFLQWAPRYQGPKFNLLHCDFPYGLDVFSGPQMQAHGHQYADGSRVYFDLLECLCRNTARLASVSAHLMFWYSEKHGEATRRVFRELAPEWVFQPFPLVWVKSDNSGIASDSRHGPRHVYETAMMATRGQRPVVRVVGDAYSAPSDRRLHVSAKPVPVLRHFFTMLVDEHTSLLDPTCGSGNALQAAEASGAHSTLGLEIDETQCGIARMELRRFRSMGRAAALLT